MIKFQNFKLLLDPDREIQNPNSQASINIEQHIINFLKTHSETSIIRTQKWEKNKRSNSHQQLN